MDKQQNVSIEQSMEFSMEPSIESLAGIHINRTVTHSEVPMSKELQCLVLYSIALLPWLKLTNPPTAKPHYRKGYTLTKMIV